MALIVLCVTCFSVDFIGWLRTIPQYLKSLIEWTPDLYLHELKADLEENQGISVNISTIYQMLVRQGYALKKNNFVATEQVEESRVKFQIKVSENYHPEQLVFVDESAVNCLTTG